MGEYTLQAIIKDAETELEDWCKANPDEDPADSAISEIADSSTPIYNSDILRMAADNIYLALNEPEIGPAFDGSPTPINIIAANIYEEITNALYSKWNDIEAEREDAAEDDE